MVTSPTAVAATTNEEFFDTSLTTVREKTSFVTTVSVKHHPHLHSPRCPLPTEHLGWAGGALMTSFASERLQVCGISKIFWCSSIHAKSGRAVLVFFFFFSFFFLFVCVVVLMWMSILASSQLIWPGLTSHTGANTIRNVRFNNARC